MPWQEAGSYQYEIGAIAAQLNVKIGVVAP